MNDQCPGCGADLSQYDEEIQFCPYCGEDLDPKDLIAMEREEKIPIPGVD